MSRINNAESTITPLQWLLHEVERTPGANISKERLRAILRGMVGERIFVTRREMSIPMVRDVAAALVAAGFTPAEAARELSARCGLRRSQARAYVVAALSARAVQAAADRQAVLFHEGL